MKTKKFLYVLAITAIAIGHAVIANAQSSGGNFVINVSNRDAKQPCEIEIHDNGFHKATSIDMDGHSVDVEITASFDGRSTEGMLVMQENSLPFSGTKS